MPDDGVLDLPARQARRAVMVAAGVLYLTGIVGTNLGPAWVDERPAVTLALSSRNRNLFASVPFIDGWTYSLIGFFRIVVVGFVLYLLGRWYGQRALTWMEGQVGELPSIYRWFANGVDRAGWLLVFLMPGSNLVALMAGHRRMRFAPFMVWLSAGTVAKLAVLWWGGRRFEDQIRTFLDWIQDYQWWVVGGLFALTFLQSANRMRKNLPEIIEEIEHPGTAAAEPHEGERPS